MKLCTKCKQIVEIKFFYKDVSKKDNLDSFCKPCRNTSTSKYYKANKRKINEQTKTTKRERTLRSQYGITEKDWDLTYISQEGKCAICFNDPTNDGRVLAVDHCHKTKRVRGLLCYHCNFMLGFARDNIDILHNAIRYLGGK